MTDGDYFNAILNHINELQAAGERSVIWPLWIPDRERPERTDARKHKLTTFLNDQGFTLSSFVPGNEQVLGRMEEILIAWPSADQEARNSEA